VSVTEGVSDDNDRLAYRSFNGEATPVDLWTYVIHYRAFLPVNHQPVLTPTMLGIYAR